MCNMKNVTEKTNAKESPKKYLVRHMNNGLAGYEEEKILVSTEAMKRMCKSFDAKPVYVGHQSVDLEKIQEEAAGYVGRCFYNELDGWLWAEITVVSDEGHEAIKKGFSVSNAYLPTEWGLGGTCHDIEYNREVLNGEFTHLAIVPNPRYENAIVITPEEFKAYQLDKKSVLEELQNSKKGNNMLSKFFTTTKKEVASVEELENSSYTLDSGETISFGDMIKSVENAKKNESEEKEKKKEVDMGMKINVGDKEMTLSDLVNAYTDLEKGRAEKANAEEDKEDNEDDKKIKDEEKKNSSKFDELKNASNNSGFIKTKIDTRSDALARGKAKY